MTRERAKELLPIITAYAEGKRIEFMGLPGSWCDWVDELKFDSPASCYRIASEPKLRPWTAEEVPVGAVLRYKNNKWSCRFLITASTEIHMTGYGTRWRYHELLEQMEYSKDGFTNWLPCGVLEESK